MAKHHSISLIVLCFLVVIVVLAGCKSPNAPDETEQAKTDPSFAADIQPIFTNNCVTGGCHDATASNGLDLRTGNAFGNLVNVVSTDDNSRNRVTPTDAQNSYIVVKIEGRQAVGGRMPLGRSALSAVTIQNIRNWITQGAKNN
jgi:hypothetical protein